jgi:hypothetical protein
MLTRREFFTHGGAFALAPGILAELARIWVNDVHSQLNRTRVRELLKPRIERLAEIVRSASRKGLPSRFRLPSFDGGQQFATDSIASTRAH